MSERPSNIAGTLKNSLSDADETYNAAVEAAKRVHAGYEAQTAAETKRADTDELTGLLNKSAWKKKMAARAESGEVDGKHFAILFIDLKDFKKLNDTHGHEAGDKHLQDVGSFIKNVAGVLQETLRLNDDRRDENDVRQDPDIIGNEVSYLAPADDNDSAGRYGGDEFVVLLEGITTQEEIEAVKARIMEKYNDPALGLVNSGVGLSIGSALWEPGVSPEKLLTMADESMFSHKEAQQAVSGSYR